MNRYQDPPSQSRILAPGELGDDDIEQDESGVASSAPADSEISRVLNHDFNKSIITHRPLDASIMDLTTNNINNYQNISRLQLQRDLAANQSFFNKPSVNPTILPMNQQMILDKSALMAGDNSFLLSQFGGQAQLTGVSPNVGIDLHQAQMYPAFHMGDVSNILLSDHMDKSAMLQNADLSKYFGRAPGGAADKSWSVQSKPNPTGTNNNQMILNDISRLSKTNEDDSGMDRASSQAQNELLECRSNSVNQSKLATM